MKANPYYDDSQEPYLNQPNTRQSVGYQQPLNNNMAKPDPYRNPQAQIQYPHLHSDVRQQSMGQQPVHSRQEPPMQRGPIPEVARLNNFVNQFSNIVDSSQEQYCSFCLQTTQTYVRYQVGCFNYVMCFLLFLCTLCCCWISFVVNRWKDAQFRCRKCHSVKYVRRGTCNC